MTVDAHVGLPTKRPRRTCCRGPFYFALPGSKELVSPLASLATLLAAAVLAAALLSAVGLGLLGLPAAASGIISHLTDVIAILDHVLAACAFGFVLVLCHTKLLSWRPCSIGNRRPPPRANASSKTQPNSTQLNSPPWTLIKIVADKM
jgi:hypothetical protein